MIAKPTVGPLMPNGEPLAILTTTPAMIQENSGTPDAKAIPKHNCDEQQFKKQSIAAQKDSNAIFTECKAPAYNFLTIALLAQVWQR